MPIVLVANPKGGVGKSTLATHIAGYYASCGHAVMLGDIDRQQSSRLWLGLRPAAVAPIRSWAAQGDDGVLRPPAGTTHAVLDSPAGLRGRRLKDVLTQAHLVVVPLQPSIFDMYATHDFLGQLQERIAGTRTRVALVGMRVDARTLAAQRLREFVEPLDWPMVAELRDTQNYVQLAARGLTLFDLAPQRVERDRAQWAPLVHWLDHPG